jgi:hypothetical protein
MLWLFRVEPFVVFFQNKFGLGLTVAHIFAFFIVLHICVLILIGKEIKYFGQAAEKNDRGGQTKQAGKNVGNFCRDQEGA